MTRERLRQESATRVCLRAARTLGQRGRSLGLQGGDCFHWQRWGTWREQQSSQPPSRTLATGQWGPGLDKTESLPGGLSGIWQ